MISSKQILITLAFTFYSVQLVQAGILDGRTEPTSKEKENEILRNVSKACGLDALNDEVEKISKLDEAALKTFQRKAKCAMACSFKMTGIINDDNQINKQVLTYAAEMTLRNSNPSLKCEAAQFYDKCYNITDEDSCEYAYKLSECFKSQCRPIDK